MEQRKEQTAPQDFDYKRYIHIVLKRKWIVIAIVAISMFYTFFQTTRITPFYRSVARIVLEVRNPANYISVREVFEMDPGSNTYLQTQFRIIKSRSIAMEVIRRLNLEKDSRFFPKPRSDIFAKIGRKYKNFIQSVKKKFMGLLNTGEKESIIAKNIKKTAGDKDEQEKVPAHLIGSVVGRTGVYQVPGTRLMDISFTSPDPVLAAQIVNEIVKVYIDQSIEEKFKVTQEALGWLNQKAEDQIKRVETAETALLKYKEKEGLMTDFSANAGNVALRELAKLNSKVVEAQAMRIELETRYQQAISVKDDPELMGSTSEVLASELVREIKKMEVVLYNRLSELSKKYGPNHPQMISVNSELEGLRKRRENEIRRIAISLRNDYKLALTKERNIKKALKMHKGKMVELNKKAIKYGQLQREASNAKQMYDMLITRLKETSFSLEIKPERIRVVDTAEPNYSPVNINTKNKMRNAALIGILLGVSIVFLLEYLDNTIKIPTEIDHFLKIPYLGPIHAFDSKEEMKGMSGELITAHSPKSSPSESFRGIRTSILFSAADIEPQVILVTSAAPGEGKSLVSANLAITMAQAGSRVILLDCDMRRPRQNHIFDMNRDKGLSSLMVGEIEQDECITHSSIDNLDLISSGHVPPNPSELLGSKKMVSFIKSLRERYTRVIIDTPPVTAVTDAAILSQQADGILLVIRSGVTHKRLVENGVINLKAVNARFLGAVLNGIDQKRDSYYYNQHYYNYYGDTRAREKARKIKNKKKGRT